MQAGRVPSHVALLRGINVGGHGRLPMADLRSVAEGLGWSDVATYIQSGNLVFSTSGAGTDTLATTLEHAIAENTDVTPPVVVLTAQEFVAVVAANPYPDEKDPKCVHVTFRRAAGADDAAVAAAALEKARAKGSRDDVTVAGRHLYLHTPDGLGRSELAIALAKGTGNVGTTRNWASVLKLREMLDG